MSADLVVVRWAGHDLDAVVQPGVSYDALNAELKERGIPLFFPVDPAPSVSAMYSLAWRLLARPLTHFAPSQWCADWRHDRHRRVWDERCAVWHDAGQRAQVRPCTSRCLRNLS